MSATLGAITRTMCVATWFVGSDEGSVNIPMMMMQFNSMLMSPSLSLFVACLYICNTIYFMNDL